MFQFTFIWMVMRLIAWCDGNTITETMKLTGPLGTDSDYFGWQIAACNDIVAIAGLKGNRVTIYDRDNLHTNSSGTTLPISSEISGNNGIACNDNFLVYAIYPNISIHNTKKPYAHVQTVTDNGVGSIDNLKINKNNTIFYSDKNYKSNQGIIKGYQRNLSSWVQFTISSPSSGPNQFGQSLAVNSIYMATSTPAFNNDDGRVQLYRVNSNTGLYDIAQTINPPRNALGGSRFGTAISMDEDWLVIGASSGGSKVYVYKYQPVQSNYIYHQALTLTNGLERVGHAVAVEGNTMVVCDYMADVNKVEDSGVCYLFKLDTGTWNYTSVLIPSDPYRWDDFGIRVVMNKGISFVTSKNRKRGYWKGAVYVYSQKTKDATTANTTATNSTTANTAATNSTTANTTAAARREDSTTSTAPPVIDHGSAVSVHCSGNMVTATVNPELLKNLAILSLAIDDCPESNFSRNGNAISTSFENCGSNITQGNDLIIQETRLVIIVGQNDSSNTIYRGQHLIYNLKCSFDRRFNASTGVGVEVTEKKTSFEKKGETNFTAQMLFHTNSMYNIEASSPLQVATFEPLYISIKALQGQNLYKFIVEDCYATPSANPLDPIKYLFFRDKCAMDNTMQVINSYNTNKKFCYKINAFRFIMLETKVYFHCRLLICKMSSTTHECTQKCTKDGRKRRALDASAIEEIYVNSQAVVYKKKPTCAETTCPLNSHCHDLQPAACRCDEGYVFDVTVSMCIGGDQVFKMTNLHLKQQFLPQYATPTSNAFIRLAIYVEKEMMASYSVDHKIIKGVKVIEARPGSIVLDLLVLHSDTVTTQNAFNHFINAVLHQAHTEKHPLRVKSITPLLEEINNIKENTTGMVALAIAIPTVAVALVIAIVIVLKSRRNTADDKVEGYNNNGITMDNFS